MKGFIHRFFRDEGGATAIEYGLICALIFLAIIMAVTAFAAQSNAMYTHVSTTISAAINGA